MSQQEEARAAFASASKREARGEGAAAIPDYERALALGLLPEERCKALVGLGVALKSVGRWEDAVRVLRAASSEFPDHAAARAFLALALHGAGEGREAMATLLELVLRHAPVGSYADALTEARDAFAHPPVPGDGWERLAASLTRSEFVHNFPFPFLLEIGGRIRAEASVNDEETAVGKRMEPVGDAPPLAPADEPFVLALRKVANAVPSALTLGRATSNDVVIRDSFVSKVHAFFHAGDGRWELADAGSRNGTWLGSRRLDSKGAAAPVRSGDVLTFGRVAFFFLDAGGLWDRLHDRARLPR